MEMKMLVRVHVVERKSGRCICFELRCDFSCDLAAYSCAQPDRRAKSSHVGAETAIRIDEIRDAARGKERAPFDEHEMKADAQARETPGADYRIACRSAADHQARRAQHSRCVRELYRFVHLGRRAEIVGRDDQMPETIPRRPQRVISRRSRRKWKNSTPSRRRRFIMSGLRTISPTIDAIFPALK
jgi:hypothetical protein